MKGAGGMRNLVTFSRREEIDDGYGNTVGAWAAFATMHAEFKQLRGGETVMASRLTGRQLRIIRIRVSETSKQITTDCKATHDGVDFNIRDIAATDDRSFLDVLVESGVAA